MSTAIDPPGIDPGRMLRLYLLVVVATATVATIVLLSSTASLDSRARVVNRDSELTLAVSDIQAQLAAQSRLLADGYLAFQNSPYFATLSGEEQAQARDSIANAILQQPQPESSSLLLQVGERELLRLHDGHVSVSRNIAALVDQAHGLIDLQDIEAQDAILQSEFTGYLSEPTLLNYSRTFVAVNQLNASMDTASDEISARLAENEAILSSTAQFSRYAAIGSLVFLGVTAVGATFAMSRSLHRTLSNTEREHKTLLSTTETLRYRNEQLTALYNVFTEITETLSLQYVIKATLHESMRVMNANMVDLRLLKSDELVAAGAKDDRGTEWSSLPPVPLGEGPIGRAARRGRTVRIRSGAQEILGPDLGKSMEVQSGIVVPLIIGARVVGTIACWWRTANAFADEDERILEMMASQVATAVIAANTTDDMDHRARHDPLTGLPNRLQLQDDVARELGSLAAHGRQAVVAMADIDHFKRFNDDFGHRVGDVTLQKVASVLRTAVRDKDRVYRYGGEEFVLVFMDTAPEEAIPLAERVRNAVESTPLSGDHLEPVGPIAISIGLALLPLHSPDFASILERADNAMYQAKRQGRNRVVLWHDSSELPTLVA